MPGPKISLCMIARDEAETLDRCLDSVRGWVSEVILVDTGSADATRAKAKERGVKLLHAEWNGDFAEMRNRSLSQASGEWILVLDGDEWIEHRPDPAHFAEQSRTHPALFATILDHLDGGALRTMPQIRLFRNDPDHRYRDAFPEQIAPTVAIRANMRWIEPPLSDLVIGHDGYRTERRRGGRSDRMVEVLRRAILDLRHAPSARYTLARERLPMRGLQAIPGDHVLEALTHLDWLADHRGVLPKRFEADAARLRIAALIASDRVSEARVAAEPWRDAGPLFEALHASASFHEAEADATRASEALDRFRACFDQDTGRGVPHRQSSLTGACARAHAAEMCILLGRLSEAERLAAESEELPGGGASGTIARALVFRARRKHREARGAFLEGTEKNPHDPWAWLGLGEESLECGDAGGAVEALSRCSRLAQGWGRADEALIASLLMADRHGEIATLFRSRSKGGGLVGRVGSALALAAADRDPVPEEPTAEFDRILSRILRRVESGGRRGLLQKLAGRTRGRIRGLARA